MSYQEFQFLEKNQKRHPKIQQNLHKWLPSGETKKTTQLSHPHEIQHSGLQKTRSAAAFPITTFPEAAVWQQESHRCLAVSPWRSWGKRDFLGELKVIGPAGETTLIHTI